jgi:hypothetical protein
MISSDPTRDAEDPWLEPEAATLESECGSIAQLSLDEKTLIEEFQAEEEAEVCRFALLRAVLTRASAGLCRLRLEPICR